MEELLQDIYKEASGVKFTGLRKSCQDALGKYVVHKIITFSYVLVYNIMYSFPCMQLKLQIDTCNNDRHCAHLKCSFNLFIPFLSFIRTRNDTDW